MFSDVVMIMVVGVRVAVMVTLLVTSLAHTGLLKTSHYLTISIQMSVKENKTEGETGWRKIQSSQVRK